jgi:hypothetical protein
MNTDDRKSALPMTKTFQVHRRCTVSPLSPLSPKKRYPASMWCTRMHPPRKMNRRGRTNTQMHPPQKRNRQRTRLAERKWRRKMNRRGRTDTQMHPT